MSSTSTMSDDAGTIVRRATASFPEVAPSLPAVSPSRNDSAWLISFTGAMIPFISFCYAHQRGATVRVLERVAKSRFGVHGFLALPFLTLSMEKCIYDTLQSIQGVDPKDVPSNRGGFPSGGGTLLPSFSLVPVMKPPQRRDDTQESN